MTKANTVESLDRSIRKFNPGTFQSDEEIIQQFVVRQREFNTVLEALRENLNASSCQHVLIVAPRGRGKTMLLARIAAELRTNATLSKHMWPVRLMEENQEIFTLADFWIEVLFHLAQECSDREPELARELRDSHTAFAKRWREDNLEHYVRAAVLEASDRLHRRLVLMVENLQELCRNVDDDFGWKLRKTLQTEPQIMLLATATCRFKGLDDAEQSFFELFRIVYLEPLSTSECQRLWRMASGDKATEREIRPLEILTGGSSRLLVIVAGFARHGSLNQWMEELVKLIDDHTEYFRGHLEILAKTERRVFLATMDLWHPSSTGEIAARARLDVRTTSTMLGRLVERGAVVAEGSSGKRRYAAAERLYCIYYKLRRGRDEAAIVSHLIHFMAMFYRETELAEISVRLGLEAAVSPTIQEGIARAMHDAPQIVSVFRDLRPSGIDPETNKDMATAKALMTEGYGQWKQGKTSETMATYDKVFERFGSCDTPELQQLAAYALIAKCIVQKRLCEFKAALKTSAQMVERFGSNNTPELQTLVVRILIEKGKIQAAIGHSGKALHTCDELNHRLGTLKGQLRSQVDTNSKELQWQSEWVKTQALQVHGMQGVAMDTFRTVYAKFQPGNNAMMREMQVQVPELVANGASVHDIVEILETDTNKSGKLTPLVCALRQLAGKSVRAPAEVLEVAADILAQIELKRRI